MQMRHVPRTTKSIVLQNVEYVTMPQEHVRCFLERFFSDEEGRSHYFLWLVLSLLKQTLIIKSCTGRCEKMPYTRGLFGKEMKHLPPFLTHAEVYKLYLRSPPWSALGRHASLKTFNKVWAKHFSEVVTPKTKRFSQCSTCSQVKEFRCRNIELEVRAYKTADEQNAHRQQYSDRAKFIADLKDRHLMRVSQTECYRCVQLNKIEDLIASLILLLLF